MEVCKTVTVNVMHSQLRFSSAFHAINNRLVRVTAYIETVKEVILRLLVLHEKLEIFENL